MGTHMKTIAAERINLIFFLVVHAAADNVKAAWMYFYCVILSPLYAQSHYIQGRPVP